jgi:hypothetical protein
MAARKRGKGGKFVKGAGKKKGPKKKRAPRASTSASHGGGSVPISLLHKMDKTLTRIDHRLVPKRVKERLHRMKSHSASAAQKRAAAEREERHLSSKYD